MFTIVLNTNKLLPPDEVSIRWVWHPRENISGTFENGQWLFILDEAKHQLKGKLTFQFILRQPDHKFPYWMDGQPIDIFPLVSGETYTFKDADAQFEHRSLVAWFDDDDDD